MAGEAKNTQMWNGADIYIAPAGTDGPDDLITAWAGEWGVAGLLDGDEGISEAREGDSAEHHAWGGIMFRRTVSKHKRTFKFVLLEDNAVTFGLVNPGSTRTTALGVRTSIVKNPANVNFAVGFELRDEGAVKRRSVKKATVESIAEIKESETEPSVFEVTVIVFPEADGTLYRTVETDPTYVAA